MWKIQKIVSNDFISHKILYISVFFVSQEQVNVKVLVLAFVALLAMVLLVLGKRRRPGGTVGSRLSGHHGTSPGGGL